MHIAIDDTYSSNVNMLSQYVTSDRRTNVAVCFDDVDVHDIRKQLVECLDEINAHFGLAANEFHFVEIANKKKQWAALPKDRILSIFRFFVTIYNHYQWPVLIQTVDHRTLGDHGVSLQGTIGGLDLSKKEDQSLMMLLLRLKRQFRTESRITLIMDEGKGLPKQQFGKPIFEDFNGSYDGYFDSSKSEPLLQIADFIAYVVNKSTNLSTMVNRKSDHDELLAIIGQLRLNSNDLQPLVVPKDFGTQEFDDAHYADRQKKGLKP